MTRLFSFAVIVVLVVGPLLHRAGLLSDKGISSEFVAVEEHAVGQLFDGIRWGLQAAGVGTAEPGRG